MKTIISALRDLLKPPPADPRRFAQEAPPWNWHGDAETGMGKKSGPVLVNQRTQTFEFGRIVNGVPPFLTDLDRAELRARDLNPDNPAYARCKEYFSKMPFCTAKEMAANSGGPDFEGLKASTCKDVLAAFRVGIVEKPTF